MKYELSIVIPTYNEKDNIEKLVQEIERALSGIAYEIVFVDDSKDDTPIVIQSMQDKYPYISLYHRENEKGLATAVLLGFSKAQGKYLAVMDADLQHPPMILRSMYAVVKTQNADFCIPSRFIFDGSDGGLNLYRKIVSGTARYMGKIMLSSLRKISDPTSGLFMFKKSVIEDADLRPVGWKIMVEVLAMADYHTVYEIPYRFSPRNAGESKLSTKVTLEYIRQLFGLIRRETKKQIKVIRFPQEEVDTLLNHYE